MELQRIRRDLEIEHACLKTWFRCNFTNPGCSRGLGKQPAQPFPHRRGCLSQAPAGPSPRWSLRHGYRCHTLGEDMIGSHTPLCVPKSRSLSHSRQQPCPQDCLACMIVGTCISLLGLLQQRTTAQRGLISNSSGGCRSEVKVSAGLVSSEVPLLGL